MVSNCWNCGAQILFGNIPWLSQAYMEEFCSPTCYQEFLEKNPDFEQRGEHNRCCKCGSKNITVLQKREFEGKVGNVLTGQKPEPTKLIEEHWACLRCKQEGKNFYIGEKLLPSGAPKTRVKIDIK